MVTQFVMVLLSHGRQLHARLAAPRSLGHQAKGINARPQGTRTMGVHRTQSRPFFVNAWRRKEGHLGRIHALWVWVRDNQFKCLKININLPLNQGPNLGHPSYINKTNSCWLDTALEVAYNIIQRSFQSYSDRFAKIPSDSIAYCLFEVIDHRHLAYGQGGENNSPKWLSSTNQRHLYH